MDVHHMGKVLCRRKCAKRMYVRNRNCFHNLIEMQLNIFETANKQYKIRMIQNRTEN